MSAPALARPRLLHRNVSEAQRDAARQNGRRSRGPISDRGELQSSANARIHGLYAKVHILSQAEQDRFRLKLQAYNTSVPRLALAVTRLESLAALETILWNAGFESAVESRLLDALSRAENRWISVFRQALPALRGNNRKRPREVVDFANL
jgi:hypothetical protein